MAGPTAGAAGGSTRHLPTGRKYLFAYKSRMKVIDNKGFARARNGAKGEWMGNGAPCMSLITNGLTALDNKG